ncbi:Down syndrome cell adhesion molecule -like protein [Halotydeus destructor]|nr:Down syndrome cell adhesion molecule -like protein [Halotydeus destructor]
MVCLHLVSVLGADGQFKIEPFFFSKSVVEGGAESVLCRVSKKCTITWLKDGTEVKGQNPRIAVTTMSTISTLLIENIAKQDAGNYTCLARDDELNEIRYTAELLIVSSPKWLVEPENVILIAGQSRELKCLATATPKPLISWWLGGNKIDSSIKTDSFILNPLGGGSLAVTCRNVTASIPKLELKCVADNGFGKPLENTVQVHVNMPARFAEGEDEYTVLSARRREDASIRCRAVGDQPLVVSWFKDKKPLDVKSVSRYDNYESKSELGITSELLIRSVERDDGGQFVCQSKNDHGERNRTIKLQVVDIPEAPLDVQIKEVWSKSATLSWSAPYNGNSNLLNYIIHTWTRTAGRDHHLKDVEVKPTMTTHMIKNLLPGVTYSINIEAANEIGTGETSSTLVFTTGEEEPSGAPTDVTVDAKGSRHVLVSWKSPPKTEWNGNITGYYILFRPSDVSQPYMKAVDPHAAVNASMPYSYMLTGLTKTKPYKVSVKAFNSAGAGPASQEVTVSTLGADAPAAPQFDGYTIMSKSAVKLVWKASVSEPTDQSSQLAGYTLYTKRTDLDLFTNIIPLPPQPNVFLLQNLEPGITYSFQLSAVNTHGESELSETMVIDLVSSPLGLTLLVAESNILLVSAFMVSLVSIVIAVLASIIYVKRAKAKHVEEIRRYATLRPYAEKCGTTRSTATYATIPCAQGHVTIRSANSQSSGGSTNYGGSAISDPDEIRTNRRLSQKSTMGTPMTVPILEVKNLPNDYEDAIYDDAPQ